MKYIPTFSSISLQTTILSSESADSIRRRCFRTCVHHPNMCVAAPAACCCCRRRCLLVVCACGRLAAEFESTAESVREDFLRQRVPPARAQPLGSVPVRAAERRGARPAAELGWVLAITSARVMVAAAPTPGSWPPVCCPAGWADNGYKTSFFNAAAPNVACKKI
jgi:hypothetical protein